MRILVVDDNVVQAEGLAEFLARHGHETSWAPCLQGALGRMRLRHYDVAVMDLMLPCCGVETLIEGMRTAPHAPFLIAFTALAEGDPTLALLPPGTPVVHKPADPEEVLRALEALPRRPVQVEG
jgi:DNA-binding response OmpR family regulator